MNASSPPKSNDPDADPHPAWLAEAELMAQCTMIQTRRGGPGGQHRNKVSTTIVLSHVPTGITAEASERRSQVENRRMALRRLREQLALEVRTTPAVHEAHSPWIQQIRERYGGGPLRIAETNEDRPAVLALILDEIVHADCQMGAVAERWRTSPSQLVRFLKQVPAALQKVNGWRAAAGLKPLR